MVVEAKCWWGCGCEPVGGDTVRRIRARNCPDAQLTAATQGIHPTPAPQPGDTDTNAAIVGGMLGALWGAEAIPSWMSGPVLAYEGREDQGGGEPRPAELRAAVLPGLAEQLYQAAAAAEG